MSRPLDRTLTNAVLSTRLTPLKRFRNSLVVGVAAAVFGLVACNSKKTSSVPIPTAAVGLLPSLDTAELTLTQQRAAAAAVQRAAHSGTLPQPVGTSVLRGPLR